jgi:hypothetical protein
VFCFIVSIPVPILILKVAIKLRGELFSNILVRISTSCLAIA